MDKVITNEYYKNTLVNASHFQNFITLAEQYSKKIEELLNITNVKIIFDNNANGAFFGSISSIPAFTVQSSKGLFSFNISTFPQNCSTAVIGQLNINPNYRNKKLSYLLIEFAEELCKACSYTIIMGSNNYRNAKEDYLIRVMRKMKYQSFIEGIVNKRTGNKLVFFMKELQ